MLDRSAWRSKLGLGTDAFVACMVANLHAHKDHATLVAAWRKVVDGFGARGRDAHLLLAGSWVDTYESIVTQVRDLKLERQIHILGQVQDVAGLLSASDLGVLSSFREGLPNAVLECMASGLAVAGTDYPGIREALGPEASVLLAPAQNAERLAECILRAARDADFRSWLGRAGVARVRAEFSPDAMGKRMVDLILQERLRQNPARDAGGSVAGK
jgi:glycosyltransferase involved in cell wall biosynthesis